MKYLNNILKAILIGFLLWAIGLFVYAVFSEPILGEAYKGSFEVNDFSEGWTMIEPDGTVTEITWNRDGEDTSGGSDWYDSGSGSSGGWIFVGDDFYGSGYEP